MFLHAGDLGSDRRNGCITCILIGVRRVWLEAARKDANLGRAAIGAHQDQSWRLGQTGISAGAHLDDPAKTVLGGPRVDLVTERFGDLSSNGRSCLTQPPRQDLDHIFGIEGTEGAAMSGQDQLAAHRIQPPRAARRADSQ